MCHPRAFFFIAASLSCAETILCTDCGLTRALKGVRLIISAPSIIKSESVWRVSSRINTCQTGQKVVKHIHKYKEVEEHRHRNIEKSG